MSDPTGRMDEPRSQPLETGAAVEEALQEIPLTAAEAEEAARPGFAVADEPAPEGLLLRAHRVTKRFGGLIAVREVDLQIPERSVISLIGPNGAGKTTFFNVVAGILDPTAGFVELRGQRMIARPFRAWVEPIVWLVPVVLALVVAVVVNGLVGWPLVLPVGIIIAVGLLILMLLAAIVRPWWYQKLLHSLGIFRSARPNDVVQAGVGRTFQNIRLFANMSALENVLVGMHSRLRAGTADALFSTRRHRREEERARARAEELLLAVGLGGRGDQLARNLPYGDQRRLEVARALASDPTLLLLDEPTAGMNPRETSDMMALIARLREDLGLSILLIEHDMKVVMGVSDRITVLDHGERIADGTPEEIRRDPKVIEAYLGTPAA